MSQQLYFFNPFLLVDAKYVLMDAIYIFIFLLAVMFFIIALYSVYARRRAQNKKRWEESIADLVNEAIFSEEGQVVTALEPQTKLWLQNPHYRQCCIDEIIKTRKGLSGSACDALKNLYEQLNLDKDSLKKLSSLAWQKKAKGIQELSSMEQAKYVTNIFRLTNNKNETVRNEAQCGLVSYYGFLGLRFLNVTVHPISEWQQIQLLNKLHHNTNVNTVMLTRWLTSDLESVRIFALKLASLYNCYEVYEQVMENLTHKTIKVRLHALEYLQKMPEDETADRIIETYETADTTFRLALINTLKHIGDKKQVPFLLAQLNHDSDDIKAGAAKALTAIHPAGKDFLQTHSYAGIAPWNTIFKQVKNELAA